MRIYNFNAGPATLPEEVLDVIDAELHDWQGSGMSVLEMSHRSTEFTAIATQAEADVRALLAVPSDYHVLFLQGGATAQFAMVPLNLLRGKSRVSYLVTGEWSRKAVEEARLFCTVDIAASSEAERFTTVPPRETWQIHPDSAYFHYTSNETIHGVQLPAMPMIDSIPVVCDMSSDILSRPVAVGRYGLIYAGAQKNLGVAGVTVIIVRPDLVGAPQAGTPSLWQYHLQAKQHSMLNTPPTFSWYVLGLVCQWLRRQGGVAAIAERNQRKAERLYAAIDASTLYRNPVQPVYRSRMNVPFILARPELETEFLRDARAAGLVGLQGHRSVGGMRASIYNAMPEQGVDALITVMQDFEQRHG